MKSFGLALMATFLLSGMWALAETPTKNPAGEATAESLPIPTEAQLNEIAAELPEKPVGPGRPITDRAAWAEAGKHPYFQKQVTDAQQYAQEPIPELTDELFNDVTKSGKRDTYEAPFRKRSTRLIAFVVAECIEDKGTYLPLIEAELQAILTEKSWAAPSHVLLSHPYGGLDQSIELAGSARVWTLATTDYWLGDKLKPETRALIRSEAKRRIFDNYEKAVHEGKPLWGWMVAKMNWNAVCTAGTVGAALTLIESPQERALFVQGALNSMKFYLEGVTDDGYCEEGVGYWDYGFGCYLILSEELYQQTQGKINLYQGDKIRQIALYMKHLEIVPGVYPAFGDASPKVKEGPPSLMWLIDQRWGMGWNADFSKSTMYATHPLGDRLFGFGLLGFPLPQYGGSLVAGSPAAESEKSLGTLRIYFKDASVLITRALKPDGTAFGVAIKGGANGGPHGHNDNGSYVVGYNQFPLVTDPGMENYTAKTFSAQRYDSMMMNSYGHDVPYVGKTLQKGGPESEGKIVSTDFTDEKDTLVMDLTSGYPVPGMVKLTRTYVLDRKGPSLTVTDEAQFSQPTDFGTAVVTIYDWHEDGPGAFTLSNKDSMLHATVTVSGDDGLAVENKVEPITAFRLPTNLKPMRLGVNVNKPATHVVMKTVIVPDGVAAPN